MGFFDDLAKNVALWGAVQASKDANGKPDPYKAAGIAAGMGNFSVSDGVRLGAMLGSQGAFDSDNSYGGSYDYDDTDDDWQLFCEDGYEYGVDPDDYETEEEYEEALMEAKYGWRDECEDGFEYDVDSEDYETEEEYYEALELAKNEVEEIAETALAQVDTYAPKRDQYMWRKSYRKQETYGLNVYKYETERDFLQALSVAREEFLEVAKRDKIIYYYCAVVYEDSPYPYHYRTNDKSLKIGDKVIVPVGERNIETIAEIVSVEQHSRLTVPYPVEKTKFILRKYDE